MCPPPALINNTYAQLSLYDFNAQTTPIETGSPVQTVCGGTSTCTETITLTPGVGNAAIASVGTWYDAYIPGQPAQTSAVVGYSLPLNSKGAVYPQQIDTRSAGNAILLFPSPPPVFQPCKGSSPPSGCTARVGTFATNLQTYYTTQGYPTTIFSQSPITTVS